MKTLLVSVLVALGLVPVAARGQGSINVNYSGGPGGGTPNVVDSSGNALADTDATTGKTVEIGYFDTVGSFNAAANAGNLTLLGQHWHLFDATNIRNIFGTAGAFGAAGTGFDASFSGNQIYLWIFDTTDGLSPTVTFDNVREYGLFSSTSASGPEGETKWTFPGTTPPTNVRNIDTSQVDEFLYGGKLGGTPGSLQLAAVPEPNALALLGVAFAVAVLAIRRPRLG